MFVLELGNKHDAMLQLKLADVKREGTKLRPREESTTPFLSSSRTAVAIFSKSTSVEGIVQLSTTREPEMRTLESGHFCEPTFQLLLDR